MSPLLVADATGFILFAKANRFGVLSALLSYADVVTTPLVVDEVIGDLSAPRPGSLELQAARKDWVQVQAPTTTLAVRTSSVLSDTDLQVLTLAHELKATLYTDDLALRRAGGAQGLTPVGSLGLIAGAVHAVAISREQALDHGDALRQAGLRVSETLWEQWIRTLEI